MQKFLKSDFQQNLQKNDTKNVEKCKNCCRQKNVESAKSIAKSYDFAKCKKNRNLIFNKICKKMTQKMWKNAKTAVRKKF